MNATIRSLSPAEWRIGDRIPHPALGITAGGWVTITAHRSNNRHNNAFRIEFETASGEKGKALLKNSFTIMTDITERG